MNLSSKTYFRTMGVFLFAFTTIYLVRAQDYTNYVNPFIGTSNFGTTNPGAIVPNGMVSVVPFNVTGSSLNQWDKDKRWWSTPYSWDNHFFTGYSHVNLSGVGCPDLGVILVMPTTGNVNANLKEFGSIMSQQMAEPGYFSCHLDKYGIATEVSATTRAGISRFKFPTGRSNILIDLGNGLTNESGGAIRIVNEQEVEGYRMVGNFCYHGQSQRQVYFVARFSHKADSFGVWKKMPNLSAEAAWSQTNNGFNYYEKYKAPISGDSVGAYFSFITNNETEVLVKVGISYVSIENARLNLETEIPDFDFYNVKNKASNQWQEALSRINVKGGTEEQKKVFYTALYHINIHPNIFSDVNGQYPKMESDEIGQMQQGKIRYTTFSLWDTYRNLHPFLALVYPDKQLNMVNSVIDMYKESGWLPKWELNGRETYTMNGDPVFPVITDTYLRGIKDFDVNAAYEAMYKHATTVGKENKIRPNQDFYLNHGYMPLKEEFDNSVSIALEYYLADWNLAQLALILNKQEDHTRFLEQSLKYHNYFDTADYKMLRPRLADGAFYEPFDPLQGQNFEPVPGFHEGTAWQYTLGVPHDIEGLIELMGGEQEFVEKLQNVFDKDLYDMANEPDIHYPFLFNYVEGEQWRTQKETLRLISKYFKNTPDGLPGNDDCGTMSAWAAYVMMGFYPICPGNMEYAVFTPVFDEIRIVLDSDFYPGKQMIIKKEPKGNRGNIKTIKLNGNSTGYFIDHRELIKGSVIEILTE